jgi:shikimate dehydrogenase
MTSTLREHPADGETGLIFFLGHPTAQAGSPQRLNPKFRRIGRNWLVVPADVPPRQVEPAVEGFLALRNVVGLIVTIPHKAWALTRCDEASEAAQAVGAVNVIRRNQGRLMGDMLDGRGCLAALEARGHGVRGRSALLVGAGGAGSAIADALAGAGLAALTVHDVRPAQAAALLERLAGHHPACAARSGPPDPTGQDLVVNATPLGMRPDDPLPLNAGRLTGTEIVVDVIPKPEITPLLAAARAKGCAIQPGTAMLDGQMDLMVDFFTRDL